MVGSSRRSHLSATISSTDGLHTYEDDFDPRAVFMNFRDPLALCVFERDRRVDLNVRAVNVIHLPKSRA